MDILPILIFWSLAFWALNGPSQRVLYLFFCTMPFGSFAVIPTGITAGLTFTPTPMIALIIIFKQCGSSVGLQSAVNLAIRRKPLFLLIFFWLSAAFATILMPRLFAGYVTVIPMSLHEATFGEPLGPTTQNISQFAYLTISVCAVFAFARMLQSHAMRLSVMPALLCGGALVIFTGILDFLSQFIPISGLLEPFRTAAYAFLTDDNIGGAKRVVGLMPEASAYGGVVISFLSMIYFLRRSLSPGILKRRVVPAIMLSLLLMLWLSTSSGAYVGFAVLSIAAVFEWIKLSTMESRNGSMKKDLAAEFWIAASGGVVICVVFLVSPQILDPIINNVNLLVFEKAASSSFEERSMWTTVSWQALLDTYGLGVGVGGTRASNSVVAIFSNTGVLGGVFYFSFLILTFTRRISTSDKVGYIIASAVFWGFLSPFVVSTLGGTSPDFGTFNSFLFGFALSIESKRSYTSGKRVGPYAKGRVRSSENALSDSSP